jgi:hypothetical protein
LAFIPFEVVFIQDASGSLNTVQDIKEGEEEGMIDAHNISPGSIFRFTFFFNSK